MTVDRTPRLRRTRRWGAVALAAAAGLIGASAVAAPAPAETATYELAGTPALAENPLKGFLPFAPEPGAPSEFVDPDFPHSMEWFYLPVDAVVTGEDAYDWEAVEQRLDAIAERGHQSVFRFYLDYPGQESGVPDYLLGEDGINQERTYDFHDNAGISFSPDYDDPRVVDLLVDFIGAFGERFDGDPRVGYVTAGLFGFWGEHHTYPVEGEVSEENPSGENWMPSQETQDLVWNAWDDALDQTWLLARYPSPSVAGHGFGLHDDSFAYATLPTTDWHFLSRVNVEGMQDAWQTAPIGGEIYPPLQNCLFDDPLTCPNAADEIAQGRDLDFDGSVTASHISWMMNHQAWATGYTGQEHENAVAAAASLGYDLSVTEATVTNRGESVDVEVSLTNRGVAPFYGDWPVSVVALDDAGEIVAQVDVDADLPGLLPDGVRSVTATLSGDAARLAGSTVALTVANPMAGGLPLRFANETQDVDVDGYLTLGAVPGAPTVPGPAEPVLELETTTVSQGGTLEAAARHLAAARASFVLAGSSEVLAVVDVVDGEAIASLTIRSTVEVGPHVLEVRDGDQLLASAEFAVMAATSSPSQPPEPTTEPTAGGPPSQGGSGDLAETGAPVGAFVGGAAGAVILGALLIAWRRKVGAGV